MKRTAMITTAMTTITTQQMMAMIKQMTTRLMNDITNSAFNRNFLQIHLISWQFFV